MPRRGSECWRLLGSTLIRWGWQFEQRDAHTHKHLQLNVPSVPSSHCGQGVGLSEHQVAAHRLPPCRTSMLASTVGVDLLCRWPWWTMSSGSLPCCCKPRGTCSLERWGVSCMCRWSGEPKRLSSCHLQLCNAGSLSTQQRCRSLTRSRKLF